MAVAKERLDLLLVHRGLVATRSQGAALIMAGEVRVDGRLETKVGTRVPIDAAVHVVAPMPFVSRGGYKLAGALRAFPIEIAGRTCADVGACTGGFTDVLLQNGASRVYAIDVGYGQLAWKLRQDPRVVVMERTNARHIDSLPEMIDFVSIDVSFISLRIILEAARMWTSDRADIIALVKPQFEAGPDKVGKGGIVRDPAVHRDVLMEVIGAAHGLGLQTAGLIRSPIKGSDGNIEFLLWLLNDTGTSEDHVRLVREVVDEGGPGH